MENYGVKKGLLRFLFTMVVALFTVLSAGSVFTISAHASAAIEAESSEEAKEQLDLDSEDGQQKAVAILVLMGGLIIIIAVVVSVVASVVSTVASAVEDEEEE